MALSVIRFDLRRPGRTPAETQRAYAAAIDMAAWADRVGIDTLVISEHHGAGDGYLPSPVVMIAAIASRTTRIPLTIGGLLVPLHDPIRLAEDLAVADLVSGGRLSVVAELGDRPSEYWMFGQDWARREELMDECLDVLLNVWTGESFDHNGDRVQVTPRPAEHPHPLVFIGGTGAGAARRAARFGFGLYPRVRDPEMARVYREECELRGHRPGFVIMPPEPDVVFVADDPDRAWAEIGEHLLYDAQAIRRWQTHDQRERSGPVAGTVEDLRAEGIYHVFTPGEAVAFTRSRGMSGTVTLHPLCGGIPPDWAWTSLELFAAHVLPALR